MDELTFMTIKLGCYPVYPPGWSFQLICDRSGKVKSEYRYHGHDDVIVVEWKLRRDAIHRLELIAALVGLAGSQVSVLSTEYTDAPIGEVVITYSSGGKISLSLENPVSKFIESTTRVWQHRPERLPN